MRTENQYIQMKKWLYLSEGVCLISWGMYLYFFYFFYHESIFFVDESARFTIQLLFVTTYYLKSILLYLVLALTLMTVNLVIILLIVNQNKRKPVCSNVVFVVISLLGAGGVIVGLLRTLLWPYFVIIMIFSFTIVYVIHVLTLPKYEWKKERYVHQEVIKVTGPFRTKEETDQYVNDFFDYWMPYFNEQELKLTHQVKCDEHNEFYVTILVDSSQKTEKISYC